MPPRYFSASPQFGEEEEKINRFEDLDLHPKSLKALRRQGLHKQTEIQEKTFQVILSGKDVVGRARTGTGKTLGFLLPALERIVRQKNPKPGIQILVLSPTRELAAQIHNEAERLTMQHQNSITSQVVYGGSSKQEDINRLSNQLPSILVATPGRLKDHLTKTKLRGGKPFIDTLQNLQVLVLDETDRLLDMGFRQDIRDILSCLPRQRQTLLFSATIPPNVRSTIALATNNGDYEMIDCIGDEDPSSHTNDNTLQSHIVLPADRFWTGSMELLLDMMENKKSKIMVFFPMTSLVQLYANIFNLRLGRRVFELHGKMHQRERSTISRRFRNAGKGVLFTSDVSARGVDYPNVTHVIQIGAAESRETYIHRLGRTGRAGKKGQGLLVLPQVEKHFLQDLGGLDLPVDNELQKGLSKMIPSKVLMDELGPVAQDVRSGKDPKLEKSISDAYQAMIAYYYHRIEDRQDTDEFVTTVNTLAQNLGLNKLPPIDSYRARKIGIDNISGLNIQHTWKDQDWSGGWGETPRHFDNRRNKKPFGKPYGDFDGKFAPRGPGENRGRGAHGKNIWEDSPNSFQNNRPSEDRQRRGNFRKGKRESSDEQFIKLGWKTGLSSREGSNARRKNKAFTRWESKGKFKSRK
jgi:ATP-dependent RNA helicase MSS116